MHLMVEKLIEETTKAIPLQKIENNCEGKEYMTNVKILEVKLK